MEQRLRPISQDNGGEKDIEFILVPGFGADRQDEWRIIEWLRMDERVHLQRYHHGLKLDENLAVEDILKAGRLLLEDVFEYWQKDCDSSRVIVFIAHSLGGLLVKEAVNVANSQLNTRESLLPSILGMLFLGTPHACKDIQQWTDKVSVLSRVITESRASRPNTKLIRPDSIKALADLAERFVEVNSGLHSDILVLFETKGTGGREKSGKKFFNSIKTSTSSKTKGVILIDEQFATFRGQYVRVTGVDLDHFELPRLISSNGSTDNAAQLWLSRVLQSSRTEDTRRRLDSGPHQPKKLPSAFKSDLRADTIDTVIEAAVAESNVAIEKGRASTSNSDIEQILDRFDVSRRRALPSQTLDAFNIIRPFWGRDEELDELDRRLIPTTNQYGAYEVESPRYAAICGDKGLGKTALALHFADTRKMHFDAIFWIQADSSEKLESDLCYIPLQLKISDPAELQNPLVNSTKAKAWLMNPTKQASVTDHTQVPATWLMIFDNVDDPELLTPYKSYLSKGSILVTSRSPRARNIITDEPHGIDLLYLDDREAKDLLWTICQAGTEEDAEKLAPTAAGSPLALAQVASFVKSKHLTFAKYLQLIKNEDNPPIKSNEEHIQSEHQYGVVRGIMSKMLAPATIHKDTYQLLDVLCFLDPDRVEERMFDRLYSGETVPDLGSLASRRAFVNARAELLQLGIIESREEDTVFSTHRMTQELRLEAMTREQKIRALGLTSSIILSAWPNIEKERDASAAKQHTISRFEQCEELYPHVICIQRQYKRFRADKIIQPNLQIAKLLYLTGWWEYDRGNVRRGKPILELVQTICEELKQGSSADAEGASNLLGDIHYALGVIANALNDKQGCMEHTDQLLKMRQAAEVPEDSNIRLAIAYNEQGIAYMMRNDWAQGEQHFLKAIKQYSKLTNFWFQMLSLPYANLGWAYLLQNKLEQAHETLTQALKIREDNYGKDDTLCFRTGRILHALGNTEYLRGHKQESEDLHKRALIQYTNTIGSNHRRTADLCYKVAHHCIEAGDHYTARILLSKAIEVWKSDGEAHGAQIARAKFRLSQSYKETRDYELSKKELDDSRGYPDLILVEMRSNEYAE